MQEFEKYILLRGITLVDPISSAATVALGAGAKKAIEKSTQSLLDNIPFKFIKDKYDTLRFDLDKGLPAYLEGNYAKCETLKTLLNRNDPIPLDDCFVAPDFSWMGKKVCSEAFLDQVNSSGGKVVITGLAGSGKSVFLKYTFRAVLEKGFSFYPIFFELRNLNRYEQKKDFLLTAIYESIHSCASDFTRAQFNHGLRNGAFYFLLDGFDELNQDIRDQISEEIISIARSFHKCALLVTSRPSDEFVSWEGFNEAKLLPFDLEKAVSYISKLRFDSDKKNDFLADLKGGLFDRNRDFLSNPLLSAMMLLTYDSFGEIPEKRHIFYAKCFDVLAREHDASKGRYKRELFSGLAMDQIEKAFMFFCAVSYVERIISFDDDQMERFVNDAVAACGLEAQTSEVIRDFRESISIMERVGLLYEFAHRSFQEYFYAKFVISDRKLSLEQKIGWLTEGFGSDDTIDMIADMDRTYFEDEFLLPNIKKIYRKVADIDPDTNPAGILSKFFGSIQTSNHIKDDSDQAKPVVTFSMADDGRATFFLRQAQIRYYRNYCDKFDECDLHRNLTTKEVVDLLRATYGGQIKIHHTNNKKLVDINANYHARRIKESLFLLCEHLETKQAKRKEGLGSLIRRHYTENRDKN
ncbi:hypothetical protein B6V75_03190 [Thioclava sp. F1Mire-8]|uniref:NACHT domain-containing protein n=1 Tax=Thioclava sp. F1Mire-8 TaxID=1973006 RepID=UPI000B542F9C|nr:NACHT domain-containing protein [Thioclava sp. F1Mire-8]OWY05152.1 hypothetical protein B6V75_03190 [Thioclava sp. F1Mire-8]